MTEKSKERLQDKKISLMEEMSRILLEEYCFTHKSAKARRLSRLVEQSYDVNSDPGTDADAIFLDDLKEKIGDESLVAAIEDLEEFLFGW